MKTLNYDPELEIDLSQVVSASSSTSNNKTTKFNFEIKNPADDVEMHESQDSIKSYKQYKDERKIKLVKLGALIFFGFLAIILGIILVVHIILHKDEDDLSNEDIDKIISFITPIASFVPQRILIELPPLPTPIPPSPPVQIPFSLINRPPRVRT
jgi:hypothetical protein